MGKQQQFFQRFKQDLEAMEKRSLKSITKTQTPQYKNGQFTKSFREG